LSGESLGLVELLLVLGIVLALAVWQLVSVRRAQRESKDERVD
jgi:hypothetical protein